MEEKKKTISVALLAYGLSGRVFHGPLLFHHPGFHLKKIWVRSGRQHPEAQYPDLEVVDELDAVLTDKDIELVVVNTPEHTHYAYAKAALLAGKNVVVEKAFTITVQEAEELIALAEAQGRLLTVFHNSRWHGDYRTISRVVQEGLLGVLVEYEAHFDRYRNYVQPDNWKEEVKPGTGSLYNLGPHLIDQTLTLFGWPEAVWADLRIQRPGGQVCDQFEVILFYPQLKATLKSAYLVREPGARYTLHGTEGSFVKYGADGQEAWLKAGKSPLDEDFGTEDERYWGRINTQVAGLHFSGTVETEKASYMGYYDNIYDAISNQQPLIVTPQQALQTMKIIEAAIQSDKENKKVTL